MISEQRSFAEPGTSSVSPPQEPSLTKLVGGIIDDVQELLKAQMELFQAEVKEDLHRTKEASALLIAGALVLLLGAIFLGLMLVYLLNWAFPELPLWGSFAIVGTVAALAGFALFELGQRKFASFNPLPNKSVAALKEAFNGRFRSHQTTNGGSA